MDNNEREKYERALLIMATYFDEHMDGYVDFYLPAVCNKCTYSVSGATCCVNTLQCSEALVKYFKEKAGFENGNKSS